MLYDTLSWCLLDVDVVLIVNCHLEEVCNAVCERGSISRTRCSLAFVSLFHTGYWTEAPLPVLSHSSLPGAVQDMSFGF